jgi:hypothetical protein
MLDACEAIHTTIRLRAVVRRRFATDRAPRQIAHLIVIAAAELDCSRAVIEQKAPNMGAFTFGADPGSEGPHWPQK